MRREDRVFDDLAQLSRAAAQELYRIASESVRANSEFRLVLSGGHTPSLLYSILASADKAAVPWNRTQLFWGDERAVPPDHPDSNFAMVKEDFGGAFPVPTGHVHRIRGELPLERARDEYEDVLNSRTASHSDRDVPSFDLTLLGVGPDGHTASLFPGSAALEESSRWVATVARAPLPPQVPRITLTLSALSSSRNVFFLVAGVDKRDAVAECRREDPARRPPAGLVTARSSVIWFLDRAAAGETTIGAP